MDAIITTNKIVSENRAFLLQQIMLKIRWNTNNLSNFLDVPAWLVRQWTGGYMRVPDSVFHCISPIAIAVMEAKKSCPCFRDDCGGLMPEYAKKNNSEKIAKDIDQVNYVGYNDL